MSYSIFIRILKYGFVIISITIILLVMYNNKPLKIEKNLNSLSIESNNLKSVTQILNKPVFMSINKKEEPFKVMAQKATRFKETPNIFNLDKPTGEIKSGNDDFFLSGDNGIFNKEIQQLKVEGNVELNDGGTLKFNTSEIFFDFKKEILTGNKKVKGREKNSFIESEGFKMFNKENKIIFTGKAKLILAND